MAKPTYRQVVELRLFDPARATDRDISSDRLATYDRSAAYDGWQRSIFPVVWFDSSTERTAANMIDDSPDVEWWIRLHVKDLPILWHSDGREYNPDLLVIEKDGTRWVVEVKMDKEMNSADVQGKREAAKRWANHVSADSKVGTRWKYLLVSETDVATAKGSWRVLKQLGG